MAKRGGTDMFGGLRNKRNGIRVRTKAKRTKEFHKIYKLFRYDGLVGGNENKQDSPPA